LLILKALYFDAFVFQGCSKSDKMLVLFETPAGFALFKVLNEGKLSEVQVIAMFVFYDV